MITIPPKHPKPAPRPTISAWVTDAKTMGIKACCPVGYKVVSHWHDESIDRHSLEQYVEMFNDAQKATCERKHDR